MQGGGVILAEAATEMRRLSRQLDSGLDVLRDQARELAESEHDYRKAVALAWPQAPEGTVPEREAWVNGHCAGDRRRRDLADHLTRAALESVRSRRTQVSALQSLLNAEKEEMAFARTGGQD
jgi:hypothetical protein